MHYLAFTKRRRSLTLRIIKNEVLENSAVILGLIANFEIK